MGPNNVVEPSSAASPWGDESWVAHAVLGWAENRTVNAHDPKNTARPASELTLEIGETITPQGIGGQRAMSIFSNILAKATRAQDDPLNLAYIPAAPTRAAVAFDAATSAANIFAGTWEAGAGAIWAENQALAWLIRLLQWPSTAEGVFVSGGTTGNLSAMHAARETARRRRVEAGLPPRPATGWRMACAETAHSSIFSAARVLDLVPLPVNEERRLTGAALTAALDELEEPESLFAVVASAGSTNAGIVDDLASLADVTTEQGIWLHVDGAYGGAGLCAPTIRPLYRGIERAQSMIVDPHKWLFAPYDCCALVYRNGADARAAHAQHASYLDSIDREEPNPTDLAIHLSRRARGLPLWFSLATHGTDGGGRADGGDCAGGRARHSGSLAPQAPARARPDRAPVHPPRLVTRALSRVVPQHVPRGRDPLCAHGLRGRDGAPAGLRQPGDRPPAGAAPADRRGYVRGRSVLRRSARSRQMAGECRPLPATSRLPDPGRWPKTGVIHPAAKEPR